MALADDIRALQVRALDELNAAHDYYSDAKVAWSIVDKVVKAGYQFTIKNKTTGTVTTQIELAY